MKDIIVVKCGGSILSRLSETFFRSIKELQKTCDVVIVHGGGPEIDVMLKRLGIAVHKKSGLRVTTAEVLEVVQMQLCGTVNKNLVATCSAYGLQAVGLSGCDGNLLIAEPIEELGFVGEVESVNRELIHQLLQQGFVPIIAPIGMKDGQLYNINGDTAAAAVAASLQARQLVFVTDVPGILYQNNLVQEAGETYVLELIEAGIITGGMIPKVQAALAALGRVDEAMIINGLQDFINEAGYITGTKITKKVGIK
ncbi:acetylglutamate kinase [Ectobacillus sp. JY-23]|uniref:acetylglutamate kinase n=1 Tax=Ectobacillus sp. JY-23 TaxID=2933872 RepID=UPI001FF57BAC|nr:acetylglutamate kinase [Ectobacillus sp. JY-23]UOY93902.1 acetylglutamate kinase [Ectobacillus sp. JY-23]